MQKGLPASLCNNYILSEGAASLCRNPFDRKSAMLKGGKCWKEMNTTGEAVVFGARLQAKFKRADCHSAAVAPRYRSSYSGSKRQPHFTA